MKTSADKPKFLPYRTDEQNLIHVEGRKSPYFQGFAKTFRATIDRLNCVEGYLGRDSDDSYIWRERLEGLADLGGDSLGVIACEEITSVTKLRCSFRPAVAHAWAAVIGFLPGDRKTSTDDQWYIEVYLPEDAFHRLADAHFRGQAKTSILGLTTDLWTDDHDQEMPHASVVAWHLRPGQYFPEASKGKVIELSWSDRVRAIDDEVSGDNEPTERETTKPVTEELITMKSNDRGLWNHLHTVPLWIIAGVLIFIAIRTIVFGS